MSEIAKQHTDRRGIALVQGAVHEVEWIFREQMTADHGIDAHIESTLGGKVTGRMIALQIKTGASYFEEETEQGFVYRGQQRHLDYWLEHSLPVLLLLVDLTNSHIYWVQVLESQAISTGTGWKIVVPRKNTLNVSALCDLSKIAINLRILRPYSVLDLDDVSHANAKRYSVKVLLNSDFPKDYIRSLASEITKQVLLETWIKNPQLACRFEGRPADVVWLYMCRTFDDATQANWLCRTEWISPDLHESFRPTPITPDAKLGEIMIVWSDRRGAMERFALEHEISKGQAVNTIISIFGQMDQHLRDNRHYIETFIDNPSPLHSVISRLRDEAKVARDLYFQEGKIGFPPVELTDLMTVMDSLFASYDNAFMLFIEKIESNEDAERASSVAASSLRSFDHDRMKFLEEARRRSINI